MNAPESGYQRDHACVFKTVMRLRVGVHSRILRLARFLERPESLRGYSDIVGCSDYPAMVGASRDYCIASSKTASTQ